MLYSVFSAFGAFCSVTVGNSNWDIQSNSIIPIIGLITMIMQIFQNDPVIFILLMTISSIGAGLIDNICTNYLIETYDISSRRILFMIVQGAKILGCAVFGLTIWITAIFIPNPDPYTIFYGVIICQCGLCLSYIIVYNSPIQIYHNSSSLVLSEFIIENGKSSTEYIPENDFQTIKQLIEKDKKKTKAEIGSQKSKDLLGSFGMLFTKDYLGYSIKVIATILLSSFLVAIAFGLDLHYSQNQQNDFFFHLKNSSIAVVFTLEFAVYVIIVLFLILFTKLNLIAMYTIPLVGCFIMIFVINFTDIPTYTVPLLNILARVYFNLEYLYVSETIESRLRNSITSLLYLSVSISTIISIILVSYVSKDVYLTVCFYTSLTIIVVLFFIEFFVLKIDQRSMGIHQIEKTLIKKRQENRSGVINS